MNKTLLSETLNSLYEIKPGMLDILTDEVHSLIKEDTYDKETDDPGDAVDKLLGDSEKDVKDKSKDTDPDIEDLLDDEDDEDDDNDGADEEDSESDDDDLSDEDENRDLEDDEQPLSKFFFKNIIFFTNDRSEEKNKTLKNLVAAIKDQNVELITFVAKEVEYTSSETGISIKDSETKYKIDKQSNTDTIVIVRLGAQDSEECMECIKELQDWGLFVLNPIQAACKASNKYASAVLMQKYDVPQPKFALLTAKDIKKGQESLNKKLKKIYSDEQIDDETIAKKLEYVVKILDGHGGTGVFMVTGKTILAILQAMFAIDPERELLLQKKEEADGGDIRVHVLTSRTKQVILASMKRVKISGDFRSNVSLGASAERVELTEEQEKIALQVAKISGMPWCAVDIMPLVKDSNPDLGDNVVLEYNSSPGTDGISQVIGKNFCEILLDAINDVNELVLAPKSVGYIEHITFKMENGEEFTKVAKLDTGNGANASTLGCDKIKIEGDEIIATIDGTEYTFKKHGQSNATVGQVTEARNTVLIPEIKIGSRKLLDVEFALVDNRNKSTKVLLNRDALSKMAYMINPGQKYVLDNEFKSSEYKKYSK